MLKEKGIREMYGKKREKIVQHARGKHSFFVVDFYKNFDVKINDYRDPKSVFYFNVPRSTSPEILDAVFSEALANYLVYGKNREPDIIICG